MVVISIPGASDARGRKRKHRNKSERQKAWRKTSGQQLSENIMTLDFETDPFDNEANAYIAPFTACLYNDVLKATHFWNEDADALIQEIHEYLEGLEERYTIYAHNGGRFDFRFLMSKISGKCLFMGSQLIKGKFGKHEIRDSLRILPMALRDYKKDDFDYSVLKPEHRNKPSNRKMIAEYMEKDCIYLFEMVKAFRDRFGNHLTVGQAGLTLLKEKYEFDTLSERVDATIRQYFWGGRVECVRGRGIYKGDYKLYDRNSMYPAEMAQTLHPVGNDYIGRTKGGIGKNTCFIHLTCKNNGAFPSHGEDGLLTFTKPYGEFFVTIHEFNAAIDLGLISHIKFKMIIDCEKNTTFAEYIEPLYEERFRWKDILTDMRKEGRDTGTEYDEAVRQDLLVKFVLNASYGKFAWNPRNARESFVRSTDESLEPPKGFEDQMLPKFWNEEFEIWEKPALRQRFNNVGTAASITGAARANMLRTLYNARGAIYCDTDSVICLSLDNTEFDSRKLGAWDLEAEFDEVAIAGKKLYACRKFRDGQKPKDKVRAKGMGDMTYEEIARLVRGESVTKRRKGVTIARDGSQLYLERTAKATTPNRNSRYDIFGRAI